MIQVNVQGLAGVDGPVQTRYKPTLVVHIDHQVRGARSRVPVGNGDLRSQAVAPLQQTTQSDLLDAFHLGRREKGIHQSLNDFFLCLAAVLDQLGHGGDGRRRVALGGEGRRLTALGIHPDRADGLASLGAADPEFVGFNASRADGIAAPGNFDSCVIQESHPDVRPLLWVEVENNDPRGPALGLTVEQGAVGDGLVGLEVQFRHGGGLGRD